MAQPILTRIEYLCAFEAKAGKQYSATDFVENCPGTTAFIMKSKATLVNGKKQPILVSIDASPMFPIEYNEITAFDSGRTPPLKYKFNQDCIVLAVKDLDVIP